MESHFSPRKALFHGPPWPLLQSPASLPACSPSSGRTSPSNGHTAPSSGRPCGAAAVLRVTAAAAAASGSQCGQARQVFSSSELCSDVVKWSRCRHLEVTLTSLVCGAVTRDVPPDCGETCDSSVTCPAAPEARCWPASSWPPPASSSRMSCSTPLGTGSCGDWRFVLSTGSPGLWGCCQGALALHKRSDTDCSSGSSQLAGSGLAGCCPL